MRYYIMTDIRGGLPHDLRGYATRRRALAGARERVQAADFDNEADTVQVFFQHGRVWLPILSNNHIDRWLGVA